LRTYLNGLKNGKFVFDWNMSGEEAAKQLGFTRLFASVYEETAVRTRKRERVQGAVHFHEVVADYESILQEEERIDELLRSRESRPAASIAFLRALQNGDVVFPGPQRMAPIPQVLLVQVVSAYPDVSLDINDPVFASIYREAREYAVAQLKQDAEIWAHDIIGHLRALILKSAAQVAISTPACERGKILGEIGTLPKFCPRLHLAEGLRKAAVETAGQSEARLCQDRASAAFEAQLRAKDAGEILRLCTVVEQQPRSGKLSAFDIRD
jgi:hypothetical protein